MRVRWWMLAILVIGIAVWWNKKGDEESAESAGSVENSEPTQESQDAGFAKLSDTDPSTMAARVPAGNQASTRTDAGSSGAGVTEKVEPAESQRRQDALRELFQRWGSGDWEIQVGANGDVFRAVGGELRGIGNSEEDLRQFASEFAGVYGVTPAEVDRVELHNEGATSVVDFPQQFEKNGEEYEVYQSWMRTIIHPETGDGILVLNELKQVEREEVIVPAPIPVEEAREIVTRHLGGKPFRILEERGNLVWATSRPHQSAYEFWVDMDEDTRRIVVGAQARAVISDESTRHF